RALRARARRCARAAAQAAPMQSAPEPKSRVRTSREYTLERQWIRVAFVKFANATLTRISRQLAQRFERRHSQYAPRAGVPRDCDSGCAGEYARDPDCAAERVRQIEYARRDHKP